MIEHHMTPTALADSIVSMLDTYCDLPNTRANDRAAKSDLEHPICKAFEALVDNVGFKEAIEVELPNAFQRKS